MIRKLTYTVSFDAELGEDAQEAVEIVQDISTRFEAHVGRLTLGALVALNKVGP